MGKSIQNIVVEKEKKMEQLYQQLALESEHPGLKNIFTMLAKMEGEHAVAFGDMSEHAQSKTVEVDKEPLEEENIKKILVGMKNSNEIFDIPTSQKNLFKAVRDFEKENELFYSEMAKKEPDKATKELLLEFAKEEKGHYYLMNDLYEMISAPDRTIENAEFNQIER
ncbi:MAG: ferritin family protein [Oligoflexia bacterium]|nr:ferritin family protein [Oligoflexia bacterium]